jgi:hypothetical protein
MRLTKRSIRRLSGVVMIAVSGVALAAPSAGTAGMLTVKVCGRWSLNPGPFVASARSPFNWGLQCVVHGKGLELWFGSGARSASHGASARWTTVAPTGIVITHASVVNPSSRYVGDGDGWTGEFFWASGHEVLTDAYNRRGCCTAHFRTGHFGWRLSCSSPSCGKPAILDVGAIELLAVENRRPQITPTGSPNLWNHAGDWVRGIWPVRLVVTDPSGTCSTSVAIGNHVVPGPRAARNTDAWLQCPQRTWTARVDTTRARSVAGKSTGAMALTLSATNAADVSATRSETVYVDNSQPWVKLSGPRDAPSTAGTQYVRAMAGGSPSGIVRILCTIDHVQRRAYSGSSARIAVAGVGPHTVTCAAENKAVDPAGKPAVSRSATWTLTIRRPTAVTAMLRQAHVERIPFGARTNVGGRLTLKSGAGLAGQTVRVLVAPDNRSGNFKQVASARTRPGGVWQVTLAPGPSRLIKAVYGGSSTSEPASSAQAKVIVPARVQVLRLWPRHVPWGGTVHIVGRLDGGYLPPPPAGEPVRLRIGYGRAFTTYGVKTDVTGNGRFSVIYRFGPGSPSVVRSYWFQECSLPHDDYPYAPACSRRITVRVGG